MNCLAITSRAKRCTNTARHFGFCGKHRRHPWYYVSTFFAFVIAMGGLYQDVLRPIFGPRVEPREDVVSVVKLVLQLPSAQVSLEDVAKIAGLSTTELKREIDQATADASSIKRAAGSFLQGDYVGSLQETELAISELAEQDSANLSRLAEAQHLQAVVLFAMEDYEKGFSEAQLAWQLYRKIGDEKASLSVRLASAAWLWLASEGVEDMTSLATSTTVSCLLDLLKVSESIERQDLESICMFVFSGVGLGGTGLDDLRCNVLSNLADQDKQWTMDKHFSLGKGMLGFAAVPAKTMKIALPKLTQMASILENSIYFPYGHPVFVNLYTNLAQLEYGFGNKINARERVEKVEDLMLESRFTNHLVRTYNSSPFIRSYPFWNPGHSRAENEWQKFALSCTDPTISKAIIAKYEAALENARKLSQHPSRLSKRMRELRSRPYRDLRGKKDGDDGSRTLAKLMSRSRVCFLWASDEQPPETDTLGPIDTRVVGELAAVAEVLKVKKTPVGPIIITSLLNTSSPRLEVYSRNELIATHTDVLSWDSTIYSERLVDAVSDDWNKSEVETLSPSNPEKN